MISMPATPWRSLQRPDPHTDYLIAASRLPLTTATAIPTVLRLTAGIARQLERSDGLVGYALLAQLRAKTFMTVSAWVDGTHLRAFVRAMPHLQVMRDLRPLMEVPTFTEWTAAGARLPIGWDEVTARLNTVAARQAQRRTTR